MHLLIDGYNFIGMQKGLQGNLEDKRQELIETLSRYLALKGYPITVIFDGWKEGWETEHTERIQNIEIVFSKRGEKADTVITRLAQGIGNRCVVVTSDREIQKAVQSFGATAIFSGEFEKKLFETLSQSKELERDREITGAKPKNRIKKGNPFRRSKSQRGKQTKLMKL